MSATFIEDGTKVDADYLPFVQVNISSVSSISSVVSNGITYLDPCTIAKLFNRCFTSVATSLAIRLPCVPIPDQKPTHYMCTEFTLNDINNDFVHRNHNI